MRRSEPTQEASHVYRIPQGNTTDAVGQYVSCVTMHYAVYTWEALVDLAVNMTFDVARLCILLNSLSRLDVILDQVVCRAH
jgi:hypothetical protein